MADAFLLCFYDCVPVMDVWVLEGQADTTPWHEEVAAAQKPNADIEALCTPEFVQKYRELWAKHGSAGPVAKALGVDAGLLRRWMTERRDYISMTGRGGGGSGAIEI